MLKNNSDKKKGNFDWFTNSKIYATLILNKYMFSFSLFIAGIILLSTGHLGKLGIIIHYIVPTLCILLFPTLFITEMVQDMDAYIKNDKFDFIDWLGDWYHSSNILWGFIGGGAFCILFLITYTFRFTFSDELNTVLDLNTWIIVSYFAGLIGFSFTVIGSKIYFKKLDKGDPKKEEIVKRVTLKRDDGSLIRLKYFHKK